MSALASVRAARATDAPAIGVVQAAVFEAAYGEVAPAAAQVAPAVLAGVWRRSLQAPPAGAIALVACAGEQVVGYAALAPSTDPDAPSGSLELLSGGVHPSAREAGHGSRLLQACVDTARETGAPLLLTWVLTVHEPVRAFLQSAGFGPDSARRERSLGEGEPSVREVRLVTSLAEPAG